MTAFTFIDGRPARHVHNPDGSVTVAPDTEALPCAVCQAAELTRVVKLVHAVRAALNTSDECIFYGGIHDDPACVWNQLEVAVKRFEGVVPAEVVPEAVEQARCRLTEYDHDRAVENGVACPRCGGTA